MHTYAHLLIHVYAYIHMCTHTHTLICSEILKGTHYVLKQNDAIMCDECHCKSTNK